MPETGADISLVTRLASGDKTALQELYVQYGQRLYAYGLRLTGDPAIAEDVIQDVMVIVWKKASSFRSEGRFIAWLLGIVHHTAMKTLRNADRQTCHLSEEIPDLRGNQPERITQRNQQDEWVRKGLQGLSPQHRAVLELVFYQGLTMEEIATVCRIPVGTVKSRLAYARQSLKGALLKENAEEWK